MKWMVVVFAGTAVAADTNYFTKAYDFPVEKQRLFQRFDEPERRLGFGDPFGDPFGVPRPRSTPTPRPIPGVQQYEMLLSLLGLEFPDGTSARLVLRSGKLVVKHHAEAHRELAELLAMIGEAPPTDTRMEIQMSLVAFPVETITGHLEFRRLGSLPGGTVVEMFAGGKGEVLVSQRMQSISGLNVQVEDVREVIYPTEFELEEVEPENGEPRIEVVPGAFETRETGKILNATATLLHSGEVNVALIPELCSLDGWLDYEGGGQTNAPSAIGQPVFESINFTSSVRVRFGKPAVVFGTTHPKTGDMVYGILVVRRVED